MNTGKKTIQDPDLAKVEAALQRAGTRAREIARKCDYFLTTDDQLVKKASGVTEIKVTDPVSFIREEIE